MREFVVVDADGVEIECIAPVEAISADIDAWYVDNGFTAYTIPTAGRTAFTREVEDEGMWRARRKFKRGRR